MKKILPILLLAALFLLSGCGGDATEKNETTPPTETEEMSNSRTENPLTGLPTNKDLTDQRPIAIMLNNLKAALPQLGNSAADIIYEVPAEGGITRMLAVYQSVEDVDTIGSIRSSRPYYLELALGHDALYIHAGGSEDAYANIKAWGVDAFDCVRGSYMGRSPGANMMWRDPDRRKTMAYEHTVVTTGEAILKYLPSSVTRSHTKGYQYTQAFTDDGTPSGGQNATTITVPFSPYKTGVFTYDTKRGLYLVNEYGKAYIDGNTNEQIGVTNVLILKTSCNLTGDSLGHVTVDLTAGDGYYACGGQIIPIHWSKADRNSPIVYTAKDGSPLTLGRGKSYVNIVPLTAQISMT